MRRVSSSVRLRAVALALLVLVSAAVIQADDTSYPPPPPEAKIGPPIGAPVQAPGFWQLLVLSIQIWARIQPPGG
jgi:hypothetical protein